MMVMVVYAREIVRGIISSFTSCYTVWLSAKKNTLLVVDRVTAQDYFDFQGIIFYSLEIHKCKYI